MIINGSYIKRSSILLANIEYRQVEEGPGKLNPDHRWWHMNTGDKYIYPWVDKYILGLVIGSSEKIGNAKINTKITFLIPSREVGLKMIQMIESGETVINAKTIESELNDANQ